MNIPKAALTALAGAALLSPCLVHAQANPGQVPTQQSPQSQQLPGSNQPRSNQAGRDGLQDSSPTSGVSAQTLSDKAFLHKAAEGGMAEIQLGQLASQKASSQDVKDFGEKMVKDHTALNDQMKPIADSMGVRLPKKLAKKDQAEYDKLNGLSGTDFDTEYLTYMVKDHHMDLRDFKAEASSTTDPALKAAVEKGTQVIQEHSAMVDSLAKSKGIAIKALGPQTIAPAA